MKSKDTKVHNGISKAKQSWKNNNAWSLYEKQNLQIMKG